LNFIIIILFYFGKSIITFPEHTDVVARTTIISLITMRKAYTISEMWNIPQPDFYDLRDYSFLIGSTFRFNTVINFFISTTSIATGVGLASIISLPIVLSENKHLAISNKELFAIDQLAQSIIENQNKKISDLEVDNKEWKQRFETLLKDNIESNKVKNSKSDLSKIDKSK
jgi:hypothetical protein